LNARAFSIRGVHGTYSQVSEVIVPRRYGFLRFEPEVRMDFTVLTQIQRRPAMLVQSCVKYLRERVLARLDPAHVVA
jgi:hypothetical protein